MPDLARITIYPVKSLPGIDVPEAVVLPSGALRDDRRFAMFDEDGQVINGKRTLRVHQVLSSYEPERRVLTLGLRGVEGASAFQVDADREALNAWLSDHFEVAVTLREAPETGFPDDTEAPGPTVIASATLRTVASWFEGLDPGSCHARFRANLEVGGTEPFWDDRLYAESGQGISFRVGAVVFEGVNPCQRCPVPARAPESGESIRRFARHFGERRKETLPAWATLARFDHFYRLAVNTRLSGAETGVIRVGDPVEILGENGSAGDAK